MLQKIAPAFFAMVIMVGLTSCGSSASTVNDDSTQNTENAFRGSHVPTVFVEPLPDGRQVTCVAITAYGESGSSLSCDWNSAS
jgi:hypothetical protein